MFSLIQKWPKEVRQTQKALHQPLPSQFRGLFSEHVKGHHQLPSFAISMGNSPLTVVVDSWLGGPEIIQTTFWLRSKHQLPDCMVAIAKSNEGNYLCIVNCDEGHHSKGSIWYWISPSLRELYDFQNKTGVYWVADSLRQLHADF